MKVWLKRLSGAIAFGAALFGTVFALGESNPIAAVVDTRLATMVCGLATLLFAIPLRRAPLVVIGTIGTLLIGVATAWYIQYEAIPVTFRSDIELSGTLFRPRGVERPGVVVFVHGSGAETRREARHYAQLLVRRGLAALTYDKRGSGKSGGTLLGVGYDGYARDVAAALRFVAARPDLDPTRIVVQGQSAAEWVIPIALENGPPVRGVILTSGTIMTSAEQVLYETGAQMRRSGYDAEAVERAQSLQRRALDYQRSGNPSPGLDEDLRRASSEPWFADADLPEQVWPIEDYRWWREVMDFDSRPYWRRVRVPVLALSGGLDPKADVRASQRRLRALLAEGGNADFTGYVFPRAEHGMIEWCHGGRLPPPCWPHGMPEVLTAWLSETLQPK